MNRSIKTIKHTPWHSSTQHSRNHISKTMAGEKCDRQEAESDEERSKFFSPKISRYSVGNKGLSISISTSLSSNAHSLLKNQEWIHDPLSEMLTQHLFYLGPNS